MKKQYITDVAYAGNTEITFFFFFSNVGSVILSDWKVEGYLEAKKEDGWVRAYSHAQMKEAIDEIAGLEDSLSWWKKYLEEIKNNLIEKPEY